MAKSDTIRLGIVIERRELDNPWVDHEWRPVAVLPGTPEVGQWRRTESGDGWVRYLCADLPVSLYRKETEAYLANLETGRPSVFVVLRTTDEADAEHEIEAVLATVSPFEAQDYLDSGEDIVESVAMPDAVREWVEAFVAEHHVEEPFRKRKRQKHEVDEPRFGKELHPIEQRYYDRRKLN